ncbi:MAG: TonB-dependent receptor domain-containing protein [Parcubacteria group bacterium]
MAKGKKNFHGRLLCGAAAIALLSWTSAQAQDAKFDIAPQSLDTALREFGVQSGVTIMADAHDTFSKQSPGFSATADPETALKQLLAGTGLSYRRSGDVFVVGDASDPQSAAAEGEGGSDAGTVQALVVTAQKREENIQDVPIAMSAFTQEDLTKSQVTGGPDLMTQVPNFTFTKTNFSGYSIQIRGIGTQAISATTDAAVAVAFNNTPFIRNRFFEQEFYDLERVEVLRGPQGTLYGRNATAGVVNILSAKPKFTYEARLSADVGNYNSTRLEGMINLPLVEDKVAVRLAGAWTKRDGYDTNQLTGNRIDGRDLWSTRLSLRVEPTDHLHANLIWEHFEEDDDRLRSGKQLCQADNRTEINGHLVPNFQTYSTLNVGCLAASLYAPESFEAPNGYSLPYYTPLGYLGVPVYALNPYASTTQSRDLRVIESTVDPQYKAETNTVELQFSADLPANLTLTSETGYLSDELFSMEDYNRFATRSGVFDQATYDRFVAGHVARPGVLNNGVFCDPQIGCADRLVAMDVSTARSRQFSQEFRLSSDYSGPLNFSLGANFLRYDTVDKYYVFINSLSLFAAQNWTIGVDQPPYVPGVTDSRDCLYSAAWHMRGMTRPDPRQYQPLGLCTYIDPNPIAHLNDLGHNYFLSTNPYKLLSYAVFGEAYYNITPELKLTAGLRWTVDRKEAPLIPSWLLAAGHAGYPVLEVSKQEWREPTGRLTVDWKPDLSFTDETLVYGSYAHGYKAGGANPPPAGIVMWGASPGSSFGNGAAGDAILEKSATHPKTFAPEFVNAYEIGTKNTLLDGGLTLNGDAFYYDYTGYQISQIVDRSAINYNFDAKVWGLELEADWRPLENLRLGFKGGYENTRVANGMRAVDVMDRTAGHTDWVVVRPFPSLPSNCIVPISVLNWGYDSPYIAAWDSFSSGSMGPCEIAYAMHLDPVTNMPYVANPTERRWRVWDTDPYPWNAGPYKGWNPDWAPNNGEGFYKDLSGNALPNAPHFTATVTADYALPLPNDWLMTLHGDFYYQSEAWARIFNTPGYDKLKAYTNVNLAAIFSNEDAGWKVMAYVKNVFDHDSITGAFLNSDDTGLTTNVFLNEPRLYGLRVTKEWTGSAWWTGADPNHAPGAPYQLTVQVGGDLERIKGLVGSTEPSFDTPFAAAVDPAIDQHRKLDWGDGRELTLTYRPTGSAWSVSAGLRYGKANFGTQPQHRETAAGPAACMFLREGKYAPLGKEACDPEYVLVFNGIEIDFFDPAHLVTPMNWSDASAYRKEEHEIIDFHVGRDFGVGGFLSAPSSIALGVRYANLASRVEAWMSGIPDSQVQDGWVKYPSPHHRYESSLAASHKFVGAGPTLSWQAGERLWAGLTAAQVNVDWSLTGGVLFGRQDTSISGVDQRGYFQDLYGTWPAFEAPLTATPVNTHRSKSATVPVLDLSLGLSYDIQRMKLSTGYRWERYFNAIDGGYQERKSYDRTIDGPYFKIAVGFGG